MPSADGTATITIYRTASDDEGSRQILCSIDGEYAGQLLYGQRLTRSIAPGPHKLSANNTLQWRSQAFEAAPGEHVEFTVLNVLWGGTLMKMGFVFFGAAPLKLLLRPGPPVPS